jgi:hypothetical protein
VTELAIIMAVCFGSGYAVRAHLAARERRRRRFRH